LFLHACPVLFPLQLQVLADRNQSFVRLLGVELGPEGPPCQRFAGVVDGGILLKLVSLDCWLAVWGGGWQGQGPHVRTLWGWVRKQMAKRERCLRGSELLWSFKQRWCPTLPTAVCCVLSLQKVEASPADLKCTDAKSMCQTFKAAFGVHE
jgi:hypothetical protein